MTTRRNLRKGCELHLTRSIPKRADPPRGLSPALEQSRDEKKTRGPFRPEFSAIVPMKRLTFLLVLGNLMLTTPGRADDATPLTLEAKIPLGAVSGRIDHMAVDL